MLIQGFAEGHPIGPESIRQLEAKNEAALSLNDRSTQPHTSCQPKRLHSRLSINSSIQKVAFTVMRRDSRRK